jgi:hypothetical protein
MLNGLKALKPGISKLTGHPPLSSSSSLSLLVPWPSGHGRFSPIISFPYSTANREDRYVDYRIGKLKTMLKENQQINASGYTFLLPSSPPHFPFSP